MPRFKSLLRGAPDRWPGGHLQASVPIWDSQREYAETSRPWERRRMQGARLLEKGYSQSEVARRGGRAPAVGGAVGRRTERERAHRSEEGRLRWAQAAPERARPPAYRRRFEARPGGAGLRDQPTGRALERDEEKIQRWKRQRWPEKKKARKEQTHCRAIAAARCGTSSGSREDAYDNRHSVSALKRHQVEWRR